MKFHSDKNNIFLNPRGAKWFLENLPKERWKTIDTVINDPPWSDDAHPDHRATYAIGPGKQSWAAEGSGVPACACPGNSTCVASVADRDGSWFEKRGSSCNNRARHPDGGRWPITWTGRTTGKVSPAASWRAPRCRCWGFWPWSGSFCG